MPAYERLCKDCNYEIPIFLSTKEFEAKPKIKCFLCQMENKIRTRFNSGKILVLLLGMIFTLVSCGGGGDGEPVSLNLSISPTSLSAGQVNVVYNRTVTMTAKGGKKPYSYGCEASGVSGITISISPSERTSDSATCTISGIPTETGSYSVGFSVTDSSQSAAFADTIYFSVKPPFPQRDVKELFVLNPRTNNISVFDASLSGDVKPLRTFGNMTSLSGPSGIAVDTTHNEIFVANKYNNSITVYSRTDSGNVAPVRTISGPSTKLNFDVHDSSAIALDTVHNEIFVAVEDSIYVYPRTADGDIAPLRTIYSPDFSYSAIAVDPLHNEIFVAQALSIAVYARTTSIAVYARTANGRDAPLRTISVNETASFRPQRAIAVDSVNNEIILAIGETQAINVYARTANGNAAPLRTIYLNYVWSPSDIAVDTVNNEIIIYGNGTSDSLSIIVYARTDSGNALPLRIISGEATELKIRSSNRNGMAVDTKNNEIVAVNSNDSIVVHARAANGNAAPLRTISGVTHHFVAFAVDALNDEIFLIDYVKNVIEVYPRTANGDVTPLRTLSGPSTGLLYPNAIAVDPLNDEILVGDSGTKSVSVYARTANGNTAPLRTFSLELGLKHLIIDNSNDEIFVGDYFYTGWKPSLAGFVTVYPRMAAGIVEPLRTIRSLTIGGMAVDTLNNEIFLAFGKHIEVYARTANIADAPLRIISTTDGLFEGGIAVDVLSNEIFVTDFYKHRISIYTRTADGEVPPSRMISGAASGVNFFGQIILL
jgi:6-phosphogluconolactonase (cycloisomerase 2 family)